MNERQQTVRGARTLPARPLAPSPTSVRARQSLASGGLRSKIVIMLGAVLIPAALIACIWTIIQDKRLHEIKTGMAIRATQRAAQDINVFLRDAVLVASTHFSADEPSVTDPDRCRERLNDISRERRDYGFAALLVDGALVCYHDTAVYLPSDEQAAATIGAIRNAMAPQVAQSFNPAFTRSQDGRYLMLGVNVPANGTPAAGAPREVFVVFALRAEMLRYAIVTTRLGIDRGTALMTRDGGIIVQSSSIPHDGDWFPRDGRALAEALATPRQPAPVEAMSASGEPSRFFTAATLNPDLVVLTGYPDALLFATERSILLSSLLPPLIMLIAAAAGTLWAVERLVVRWITYLQRVTRVYGSGRLAARAVHIGDAPREIAELGESFNQMADNIARLALQRERAASDKDTLLRELHHRVKNNFQVIVSLLSLQKAAAASASEAPPSSGDAEGLRFIEDHVQAMSVAYRVGYSSGDLGQAPPAELMHDVIDCLRRSAGLTEHDVIEEPPAAGHAVDLDRALGIALYFAAALPAYLDGVADAGRESAGKDAERPKVRIGATILSGEGVSGDRVSGSGVSGAGTLRLSFSLVPPGQVKPSPLHDRLARAYVRQLGATLVPGDVEGERVTLVPLASPRS